MKEKIEYNCPNCGELLILNHPNPNGLRIFKDSTTFTCPECGHDFSVEDYEFSEELVELRQKSSEQKQHDEYALKLLERFDAEDIIPKNKKAITAYLKELETALSTEEDSEIRARFCDIISLMYWWKDDLNNAIEYSEKGMHEAEDSIRSSMLLCYYVSKIEYEENDIAKQHYSILQVLQHYDEIPNGYLITANEYKNAYKESKQLYVEHFLSIPPEERRFIVFSDKFNIFPEEFYVLPLNMMPKNMLIDGDPEENELYIRHPYRSDKYFLARDYAIGLFRDKLREFKKIMVNLGAKKIEYTDTYESREIEKKNKSIGGKAKGNIHGAGSANLSTEYQNNKKQEEAEINKLRIVGEYPLNPSLYPAIPDGTVWLDHDENWKDEVEFRLIRGTTEDHYSLTVNKSIIASESTQIKIEAGMKTLAGEGDGNFHFDKDVFNSVKQLHTMDFTVEFYPLSAYDKPK